MSAHPLLLDFQLQRGDHRLAVECEVHPGETLAIVGPNGAGKTTLLHAIAGLLPIDQGSIGTTVRAWDAPAQGVALATEERGVGLVFQEDRLFPHLNLKDNLAFGIRVERTQARQVAQAWLAKMGLADRGKDRPLQLSGGERQRLALARALAAEPEVLLLDEALAAVDAGQRPHLRSWIKAQLADFAGPRVLVTHDAVDAFTLADRIAVLEQGRITQCGTAAEICARPATRFVADLIGVNLLQGEVHERSFRTESGAELVVSEAEAGPSLAVLHPRAIALFPEQPSGSPRNVWQSEVAAIEATGDRLRVRFAAPMPVVAELTPAAIEELGVQPGKALWLAVKATEIQVYPA